MRPSVAILDGEMELQNGEIEHHMDHQNGEMGHQNGEMEHPNEEMEHQNGEMDWFEYTPGDDNEDDDDVDDGYVMLPLCSQLSPHSHFVYSPGFLHEKH